MTEPSASTMATLAGVAARLEPLYSAAAKDLDPALHGLCRARMAQLLGVAAPQALPVIQKAPATDDRFVHLPHWPTSSRFTDVERAALAVTEQFVVDAHGLGAADVDELATRVPESTLLALAMVLCLDEGLMRLSLALHAHPGSASAGGGGEADA